MISFNSILATGGLMENLPMIIFIVMGVALAGAFAMGFVKGFRKVSWEGLSWFTAAGAFIAAGSLAKMESMAVALVVALVCALGSFALYSVLAYFLRPKMRWIKDDINGDTSLAEYGLEFEPEYLDYDGEHDYAPYGKRIYKTGYGAPSFFFRLLGGITCAVNVGMVLASLLGVFLLVVNGTALSEMNIGLILNDENMKLVLGYAEKYALDVLSIGMIIFMAKHGYRQGLVSSLRSIGITIGAFVAVGVSFFLPFSEFAAGDGVLASFVTQCGAVFEKFGPLSGVLGKVFAGIIFLALFSIVLILLNIVLKNVCDMINGFGLTREMDGYIAAVVYAFIGAALCVGMWFILAGVDILGLFAVGNLFTERAYLSNELYKFAKAILEPFLAGA